MGDVYIVIAELYFLSWGMSNKRINNILYNGIIVPKRMKLILNPFKKDNEFDFCSILVELYAHISLLIVCIYHVFNEINTFNIPVWLLVTFSFFCFVGGTSFVFDLKKNLKRVEIIGTYFVIILCYMAALVALFRACYLFFGW